MMLSARSSPKRRRHLLSRYISSAVSRRAATGTVGVHSGQRPRYSAIHGSHLPAQYQRRWSADVGYVNRRVRQESTRVRGNDRRKCSPEDRCHIGLCVPTARQHVLNEAASFDKASRDLIISASSPSITQYQNGFLACPSFRRTT